MTGDQYFITHDGLFVDWALAAKCGGPHGWPPSLSSLVQSMPTFPFPIIMAAWDSTEPEARFCPWD